MKILVKHIAAAIHTAETTGIRVRINGVFVDGRYSVSTNGAALSAYRGPESDEYLPPFIIPLPYAKLIAKLKPAEVDAVATPYGQIDIGGVVFSPLAWSFPDWRRVVGKAVPGSRTAHLNPELLYLFVKVAKALGRRPEHIALWNVENDPAAARVAIAGCESEFMGVIMGFRATEKVPLPECGEW